MALVFIDGFDAEVIAAGSPMVQTEAVYAEVIVTANPLIQTSAVYAEVITIVQRRIKGWGIIK